MPRPLALEFLEDRLLLASALFKDLNPGLGDSFPAHFAVAGNQMFFSTYDGEDGGGNNLFQLWRYDGSPQGTVSLKSFALPGVSNDIRSFTPVGDTLFFKVMMPSEDQLWKSDGTPEGTVRVADLYPGEANEAIWDMVNHNGQLYFFGSGPINPADRGLWTSDGTEAGTQYLFSINYPVVGWRGLHSINQYLVYGGPDLQLWSSNGTEAGTQRLIDLAPGGISPQVFVPMGGHLYFLAPDNIAGPAFDLYRTDGTPGGTSKVFDLNLSGSNLLGASAGRIWFSDLDNNLWTSNGTPGGTVLLKTFAELGFSGNGYNAYDFPFVKYDATVVGDFLIFKATEHLGGALQPWVSDGTIAGTQLLVDEFFAAGAGETSLATLDDQAWFFTTEHAWRTDGTLAGSRSEPLPPIAQELYNNGNGGFVAFQGSLFFAGDDAEHGIELWQLVPNAGPVANAGGPYTFVEGANLNLNASGSSDPDGDPLTYSWDVNNDGVFGDAIGAAPMLTWAQLEALGITDGPALRQVKVRVSDGIASPVDAAAALTVNNAPPTATFTGPGNAAVNQPVQFNLTNAADPASADQAAGFTYSFDFNNDGDFTDPGEVADSTSPTAAYTFVGFGTFTIRGQIKDKDGGVAEYTTQVVVSPAVSFQLAASTISESLATAPIRLVLSHAVPQPVTVTLALAGGTATLDRDFRIPSPFTVVIPANATAVTLKLPITNDLRDEFDETVILQLAIAVGAAPGGQIEHTLTILDNDAAPKVAFLRKTGRGVESAANPVLGVRLSRPSEKPVTVAYAAAGGTALGIGVDFSLTAGMLSFAPGEVFATIPLLIVDDGLDELNKTVVIALGAVTNASLGLIRTHTYTIVDDDPVPAVSFLVAQSAGLENQGFVDVVLWLSAPSLRTVSVNLRLGGTALNNSRDYHLDSTVVTFAAGETQKTVRLTIVNDAATEVDKTIMLTLVQPGNARLGLIQAWEHLLVDEDA